MEKEKSVKLNSGGEKHIVYKNKETGEIMVTHPGVDKGKWDTIDLTDKSGAKSIKQGVKSVKKWHKEHPYDMADFSLNSSVKILQQFKKKK